jgi:hypothetical protein
MLLSKARKEKKLGKAKGKRQGSLIGQVEVGYRSQFCTPTYLQKYFAEDSVSRQWVRRIGINEAIAAALENAGKGGLKKGLIRRSVRPKPVTSSASYFFSRDDAAILMKRWLEVMPQVVRRVRGSVFCRPKYVWRSPLPRLRFSSDLKSLSYQLKGSSRILP